jgi:NADPH:quinone reductase
MKEALVHPDLTVKVVDSPIPTPGKDEVLIKVAYAGTNPKDWKFPARANLVQNAGDDMAGVIEQVGEDVLDFKPGDRVAAFHRVGFPGGAFAEFAIAPASTTLHLPQSVSFQEVRYPSI